MERLTRRNNKGIVGIKGYNGLLTSYCYECTEELEDGIWLLEDAFKKLAEYEDLEEQGLLLKLPCKVGDTIYRCGDPIKKAYEWDIEHIDIFYDEIVFIDDSDNSFTVDDIGKTVFLTREEAEKKLKELEGK